MIVLTGIRNPINGQIRQSEKQERANNHRLLARSD
jgi:hypothetical protein